MLLWRTMVETMNVIALTVFVGLVLVTLFVLLFVTQVLCHPSGGGQESLLPLTDENTRSARKPIPGAKR